MPASTLSCMEFQKLSDLVIELDNPQKSDVFVKLFRAAVRDGTILALDLPERFTMPKKYRRRKAAGTYERDTKDMLFEVTAETQAWFESTRAALRATGSRKAKPKPSLEAVESGAVDFKAAAAATRRELQAKFARGQKLGLAKANARNQ